MSIYSIRVLSCFVKIKLKNKKIKIIIMFVKMSHSLL